MKGIDPHYADITDYILKCIAMILEGRDIAALDWHYGDETVGFLSSHRIVSNATHRAGAFGRFKSRAKLIGPRHG